nr:hypothetical protein [Angustibacter aerolatus]
MHEGVGMGFLDRLLGREPRQQGGWQPPAQQQVPQAPRPAGGPQGDDERAVARYRYLLRTAPPEEPGARARRGVRPPHAAAAQPGARGA